MLRRQPRVASDARIRRGNRLAVAQVVVLVDVVEKQNARLGKVVGRAHHRVPQLTGGDGLINPLAVGALESALRQQRRAGPFLVDQLPRPVFGQRLHEGVGHADRDVEIVPAPRGALGGDEFVDIRVVHAQHAHLRAAPGARAFNRGAGLVKHVDVAARPGRHRRHRLDLGAARADARKVVADAAAAPHGFSRFAQCFVNAGKAAAIDALDAVADRLDKAVDQRGLNVGARRAHDAARADGARVQVFQKQRLVLGALGGQFDRGQRPRHAAVHVFDAAFTGFEVFFFQHVLADGLGGGQVLRPAEVFTLHVCFP